MHLLRDSTPFRRYTDSMNVSLPSKMHLLRNTLRHRLHLLHVCIFTLSCVSFIYFVLPLYSRRVLSLPLSSRRVVSRSADKLNRQVAIKADKPTMILERLSVVEHPRAICIDSSPAAFYHNIVDGLQEKDVIIYLAGGGHCFSSKQCQQRCSTSPWKCSSRDLPRRRSASEGILSSDPVINPHFYHWSKVELHYCSSDVYFGNSTIYTDLGSYVMNGKYMLPGLLKHLMKYHRLSEAHSIMLVGSSAGSFGVQSGTEYIRKLLPNVNLYAVMDSGYMYLDADFRAGICKDIIRHSLDVKANFWGNPLTSNLDRDDWWNHISIPVYFVYNRWDILNTAFNCIQLVEKQLIDLELYSNAVLNRVAQMQREVKQLGLFIPGCVGHGLVNTNIPFSHVRVGRHNITLSDNLWNWMNSLGPHSDVDYVAAVDWCKLDAHSIQCNPTCVPQNVTEYINYVHA